MIELEEALSRLLGGIVPLGVETVPLRFASGRFSATEIPAPIALPTFDNSMFDGYAVRALDVVQASSETPVALKIVGEVPAGSAWPGQLKTGEAVRIFTGAPLPAGADAIVMQEDVSIDAAAPGQVSIIESSKPWEGVRFAGEDVKSGRKVIQAGERLNAGRLGLLAALGFSQVEVGKRPVVGIFSTGDELVGAGNTLQPGQIFESNSAGLIPLIEAAGATVRDFGVVRDELAATTTALKEAFACCDAVVTSGGVSVGDHDHIKNAFELAGGHLDLWRVAIKPGKPFAFGRLEGKSLFGLPGNPVSAMVTCLLLVRPALLRLQGAAVLTPRTVRSELGAPLSNDGGRTHFVRVRFSFDGTVESCGLQASHALAGFAEADGLVKVPPRTNLPAGTRVDVLLWE